MKEKYTKPSAEIEAFATVDVITTSDAAGSGPIELPDIDL